MAIVNVSVPGRLKRMVDSEAGLVGLRLGKYVARALYNQVQADRAARSANPEAEKARVEKARSEAGQAAALSDD